MVTTTATKSDVCIFVCCWFATLNISTITTEAKKKKLSNLFYLITSSKLYWLCIPLTCKLILSLSHCRLYGCLKSWFFTFVLINVLTNANYNFSTERMDHSFNAFVKFIYKANTRLLMKIFQCLMKYILLIFKCTHTSYKIKSLWSYLPLFFFNHAFEFFRHHGLDKIQSLCSLPKVSCFLEACSFLKNESGSGGKLCGVELEGMEEEKPYCIRMVV